MYTVYVLYSPSSNKTYTGYTSDITSRLHSHNVMANKGYTVRYRPWILIYTEEFSTKTAAIKRENELKTGKERTFIRNIIKEKSNK